MAEQRPENSFATTPASSERYVEALLQAARDNDDAAAETLLGAGVNPTVGDGQQPTPIWYAGNHNPATVATLLLRDDRVISTINAPDATKGASPLLAAADTDSVDVAKMFLANGANVNFVTPKGITPLIRAAMQGNRAVTTVLLQAGADCSMHTQKGK